MLTGCRLVDCSLISQQNFISDAYKTNSVTSSRSMNAISDISSDARFNFYKDDFAMHNFYSCFCITKHLLNVSIFRLIYFGLASSNWKPASKIKCSSSRTQMSDILDQQNVSQWPSNRHKNHECCKSCLFSWWPWWLYVCLCFADDQIESRSVSLLCLHHVMSHSIVVTW